MFSRVSVAPRGSTQPSPTSPSWKTWKLRIALSVSAKLLVPVSPLAPRKVGAGPPDSGGTWLSSVWMVATSSWMLLALRPTEAVIVL